MTNEEAIEFGNMWLEVNRDCKCSRKIWIDSNTYEFFQTAIKALKQEPYDNEDNAGKSIATAFQFGTAMGFAEKYDKMDRVIEEVKKAVTMEQQPCEDAISRKAVINTLDKMDEALDTDRTVENYKMLLTECYKVLPPLLNQRKVRTGDVFK